jgi:hypothetical protein
VALQNAKNCVTTGKSAARRGAEHLVPSNDRPVVASTASPDCFVYWMLAVRGRSN